MAQPSLIGHGWWSLTHDSPLVGSDRPQPPPDGPGYDPRPRRRAIIVEDEPAIALSLEADMRELGFETCDLAADGQQAFVRAERNQPDVVIMDINLEGHREGIEVARRFREVCNVPIIFVTGYTDSDTMALIRARVPGAAVLSKPFYKDRLADAVAEVI